MSRSGQLDDGGARRCAYAMLLGLFGFAAFITLSMLIYPGGNWFDRAAVGHRFCSNFFCDLTQPISLSGVDNRWGARLASFGMWCLALALAGFFWVVPIFFAAQARTARAVRAFGEGAVFLFCLVPLVPSERFGVIHGLLALLAGALGIVAVARSVWALFLANSRGLALLGGLTLTLGAAEALTFAVHLRAPKPPSLLPGMQKLNALLLMGWVGWVAWLTLSERRRALPVRPRS